MAAIQDQEGRRGLFGETTTEYALTLSRDVDVVVNQVYQHIVDRFDPNGGVLQYLHVLRGWLPLSLEEARTQLVERFREPLQLHYGIVEATLHDPHVTFTTGGLQIRKPGEPRAAWRMDLNMTLVERKGDGNVRHDPATNTFVGGVKGIFGTPLSLTLRQLAG